MTTNRKSASARAADIMTRNPDTLTPEDPIAEAARMMVKNDCGAIPVVESKQTGKIVGMVTDRDIVVRLVAEGKNVATAKVSEAMSRGVHTVRDDQPLDEIYDIMSREQVRRVPVVGKSDEVVGIIAVADVASQDEQDRRLGRTVEEISESSHEHRPRP